MHAWRKHAHVSDTSTLSETVRRYTAQARLVVDVDYWIFVMPEVDVILEHQEKSQSYSLSDSSSV